MIIRSHGTSLTEVLVALVVLSVGLLSLFSLQTRFTMSAEHTLQSLRALHQLESQLEFFRSRSGNVSGAAGSLDYATISSGQRSDVVDGITLTWDVVAASAGGYSTQQIKQIHVQASWQDRTGETHIKKLTTLLSQYGEFD